MFLSEALNFICCKGKYKENNWVCELYCPITCKLEWRCHFSMWLIYLSFGSLLAKQIRESGRAQCQNISTSQLLSNVWVLLANMTSAVSADNRFLFV